MLGRIGDYLINNKMKSFIAFLPQNGVVHISAIVKKIMNNSIDKILKEANENFEKINSKGNKFKSRQIPIYIRKNLMKP
jgi:hypothetical protein